MTLKSYVVNLVKKVARPVTVKEVVQAYRKTVEGRTAKTSDKHLRAKTKKILEGSHH